MLCSNHNIFLLRVLWIEKKKNFLGYGHFICTRHDLDTTVQDFSKYGMFHHLQIRFTQYFKLFKKILTEKDTNNINFIHAVASVKLNYHH